MADFNVKTISSSSKITSRIEVNIDSLEREYKGNELNFFKTFKIDSGNGSHYFARMWIRDYGQPKQVKLSGYMSKNHQKRLQIDVADVQKAKCDINITISEKIVKKIGGDLVHLLTLGDKKGSQALASSWYLDDFGTEKFKSFKADITFEFEPSPKMIYREKFKSHVNSFLVFKPDGKGEDFQIVCQGKKYGFNKSNLSNISPVFERMLTNPNFKEYKDDFTEIKNTNPKTIEAFKNIMSLDYCIEKEELSVELLTFADKYQIHPLYKLCQEHLCTAISKENLFDVIKAAHYIKDEELMAKSAEFIAGNHGTFDIKENPEWKEFCKKNPECGFEILNLMMSKK